MITLCTLSVASIAHTKGGCLCMKGMKEWVLQLLDLATEGPRYGLNAPTLPQNASIPAPTFLPTLRGGKLRTQFVKHYGILACFLCSRARAKPMCGSMGRGSSRHLRNRGWRTQPRDRMPLMTTVATSTGVVLHKLKERLADPYGVDLPLMTGCSWRASRSAAA
jgi:hypothetical protein